MPKRKSNDDSYEYLRQKLKKLERKMVRGRRRFVESSSSSDTSPLRRSRSTSQDRPKMRSSTSSRRTRIRSPSPSSDEQAEDQAISPSALAAPLEPAAAPASPAAPAPGTASSAPGTGSTPSSDKQVVSEPANPAALLVSSDTVEPDLDPELLQILGIDPTEQTKFGKAIQKDLAVRFEHCATSGLTKESRKELNDKYLIPSNCTRIDAPALNLEVKAALTELVAKKDKAIESKQKLLASAISALSEAITLVLSAQDKNPTLVRLLMDSGRMLCDCQYNDSLTRRNFILSSLKKEMKEQIQNTKIDKFLFGENFLDTLKAAKAINKSGAELKVPEPARSNPVKKTIPGTSKNWKASNPARKQTAPKQKSTTTTTTKTPRSSSYKQSQGRRSAYSQR